MNTPTPRSHAEPMAFTGIEFFRGAIAAWLWALGLTTLGWAVVAAGIGGIIALIYATPAVTAATVLFAVVAWALGRLLRRVRAIAVHLVLFAALGAAVGAVTTAAFGATLSGVTGTVGHLGSVTYAVNIACGALAVPLGWWHVAARVVGSPHPRRRAQAPRSGAAVDIATENEVADRLRARQSEG